MAKPPKTYPGTPRGDGGYRGLTVRTEDSRAARGGTAIASREGRPSVNGARHAKAADDGLPFGHEWAATAHDEKVRALFPAQLNRGASPRLTPGTPWPPFGPRRCSERRGPVRSVVVGDGLRSGRGPVAEFHCWGSCVINGSLPPGSLLAWRLSKESASGEGIFASTRKPRTTRTGVPGGSFANMQFRSPQRSRESRRQLRESPDQAPSRSKRARYRRRAPRSAESWAGSRSRRIPTTPGCEACACRRPSSRARPGPSP